MKKCMTILACVVLAVIVFWSAIPSAQQNADIMGPGPMSVGSPVVADVTGPGPMTVGVVNSLVALS